MRISSAPALLALAIAGCGHPADRSADTRPLARAEAKARADADDDGRILCARDDAPLARTCTVDQLQEERGLVLTVRHPDGGFHRLLVTRDGRGVVAADGAEPARVATVGTDGIEVAVGHDRYRLPATVKPKR